jgi:hypothetical protein
MHVATRPASKLEQAPDELLVLIGEFVALYGLRDETSGSRDERGGVVARVYKHIRAMRAASRQMRKTISMSSVRSGIARVLRVALPHIVSTSDLLALAINDRELVPIQQVSASGTSGASGASAEASVALLSRLVDLSRAARAARTAVLADTRHAPTLEFIVGLIDSARPALLESLRKATVGADAALMYPHPEQVADSVIGQLKAYPYARIRDNEALRRLISTFLANETEGRAQVMRAYGPLCLWDVSECTDFSWACAGAHTASFNSDLFWNTSSATVMTNMFRKNLQFKGHIGTWDVRKVKKMDYMFAGMVAFSEPEISGTAIEDSGIGNWNTSSLIDASYMFLSAKQLSRNLDLSRWTFGENPNMTGMFKNSGIVDCGIGDWNVSNANTRDMLADARRFTAFKRLRWPEPKINDANVPDEQKTHVRASAFGAEYAADTTLVRIMADAHRKRSTRDRGAGEGCAIL